MICKLQNLSLSNVFFLHPVACCAKAVAIEYIPCWCHCLQLKKKTKKKHTSMIKNPKYNFLSRVLFEIYKFTERTAYEYSRMNNDAEGLDRQEGRIWEWECKLRTFKFAYYANNSTQNINLKCYYLQNSLPGPGITTLICPQMAWENGITNCSYDPSHYWSPLVRPVVTLR